MNADEEKRQKEFHQYCRETKIPTSYLIVAVFVLMLVVAAVELGDCYNASI